MPFLSPGRLWTASTRLTPSFARVHGAGGEGKIAIVEPPAGRQKIGDGILRVLVVGGAGYVGGAVTDLLAETDHEMRVFDCLLYEESYRKPIDFSFGDVRDFDDLIPHLKWADAVVWLAALVGDGACALDPEATAEINQVPLERLVESFSGRIVFTSTCSVYGAQAAMLTEDSPTGPLSVYASTKLAAEEILFDSDAAIFRLGTLFGVGDLFSRIRLDLVVNVLTMKAYQDGHITVFGGDQYRPLLHVKDAARALVDSIESKERGIFNLSQANTRIIDLAQQVATHFPDLVIETTEIKFQDLRDYRVSSDKAERLLGFDPVYTMDDGIREIKALVEQGRLRDLENPRFANHRFLSEYRTHLLHDASE